MSIWDHMHKAARPPAPTKVAVEGTTLVMGWDDGVQTRLGLREVRVNCPCAVCVDEHTGVRILDPATVPADVGAVRLEPVGNYAVRVVFTDGHDTGLFDWALLRKLSSG